MSGNNWEDLLVWVTANRNLHLTVGEKEYEKVTGTVNGNLVLLMTKDGDESVEYCINKDKIYSIDVGERVAQVEDRNTLYTMVAARHPQN